MPSSARSLTNQIFITIDGNQLRPKVLDLLMRVVVDQHTHLPTMFSLEFKDPVLELMDSLTLFGLTKAVTVTIQDDYGAKIPLIEGEITALEPIFDQDEAPRLVISGYDKSHRLYRQTKSRAFLNRKDSDIAFQIAGEAGLTASVQATETVYQTIIQDNQSDLAFLMERAWRIGFECYVDGQTLYFRKPPQTSSGLTLDRRKHLIYFHPRLTLAEQVNEVLVRGWDVDEQKTIVGRANKGTLYPKNGLNDGATEASNLGTGRVVIVDQPVVDQAEANQVAQARLDEISGAYIEAEGVVLNQPSLRAGKTVELTGLGTRFSGTYMVTNARHVYDKRFLKTTFTVRGTRTGTLAEQSLRHEPLRRWPGVVTAIVTNNNDPQKLGRVKVKFPWMEDLLESDWARVASPGAGPNAGFDNVPGVNDDVLVAFEHGDFNRPFVLGGLWSKKKLPPEPSAKTQNGQHALVRTWRSRQGHLIAMHETPTNKKIEISTTGGHIVVIDDSNKLIELKSSGGYKVALDEKGGKIEVIHPGGQKVTLDRSKVAVESKGVVQVKSSGNLSLEAGGMLDIKANGPVNIKGAMVNIN